VPAGRHAPRRPRPGPPGERQARERAAAAAAAAGAHQPGIATRKQAHLSLVAFDVADESRREELRDLFAGWSRTAAYLRHDFAAARLELTFGLGAGLFATPDGRDRFGLAALRPARLTALPAFAGDALEPARGGGDVCVQACAEHPEPLARALVGLVRAARGVATPRWAQSGFLGRADDDSPSVIPRDLLGFKEGARNLRRSADLDRDVWIRGGDRSFMAGGTYLVYRRIRFALDAWEALPVEAQEQAMGREKRSGELRPDPAGSHVGLSAPLEGEGAMLRRGYAYCDGVDPATGDVDAGLVFLCFVRDPRRQYVPVQRRLADADPLSAHAVHTAGALFAIPGPVRPGGFVAEGLFG
jgi:deferrochelatase/peroxidase EfeB